MKTEAFREITYSDESKFEKIGGKIQLKEYKDNVIFYNPFDTTIEASYCIGEKTAVPTNSNYYLMNFGVFAQHLVTETSIKYDKSNFISLIEEGTIQFRIKTDFIHGFGYQEFLSSTPTNVGDGTYSFYLKVADNEPVLISFDLVSTDILTDIYNAVALQVTSEIGAIASLVNNKLRISSYAAGDSILITEGEDLSLIEVLGGLDDSKLPNPPSIATTILSFKNALDDKNRIDIIHTILGELQLIMYDKDGVLKLNKNFGIWNISYLNFYAFELSFNKNFVQIFINGNLYGLEMITIERDNCGDLYISGSSFNPYKIDELIIYNKQQNYISYSPSLFALTKYSVDLPYVDVNFGNNITQDNLSAVSLLCSETCHFVVGLGTQFYYYLNNAWYFSDGSYNFSMTKQVFIDNIITFYINNNLNFIVRIYFESDGITPCYLDEINLTEITDADAPARIIGVMSLQYPVDLSTNTSIQITTDLGTKIVDLTTNSSDKTKVTLEEIKKSINEALVPGLAQAYDDGSYHLVLETITHGSLAYLKVDEVV